MNLALFVTLVATLAQSTAPAIPGFGRPWFEQTPPNKHAPVFQKRIHQAQPQVKPACAMRVIVPRKHTDPKIVIEPPQNVSYSIRIIEPSCR
ncbi:hypothetical protein BH18ACI5_BH18ACI5_12480 [soil metagenome]